MIIECFILKFCWSKVDKLWDRIMYGKLDLWMFLWFLKWRHVIFVQCLCSLKSMILISQYVNRHCLVVDQYLSVFWYEISHMWNRKNNKKKLK